MTYTRSDYLDDKCTYHEYYSQFDCDAVRAAISPSLLKRVRNSTDKHLNDIELATWDWLAESLKPVVAGINRKLNGKATWCLADGVCVLKTTARNMIQEKSND